RVLTVCLLIVLVLTFSRGGFISLGAGAALFVILRISQSQFVRELNLQRVVTALIPVGLIVGVAAVIVLTFGQATGHSAGDALRLNLWRSAVAITRDHPVLGVGPGLFGQAVREYRDPVNVDDRLGAAHSVILNTAAEDGLIGLVVLGLLAALTFRAWWRLWRDADSETIGATHESPRTKASFLKAIFDTTNRRKIRLEVAFSALVGFAAQSMFDNFNTTPLVALVALLAVYCTVEPRSALSPDGEAPRGHKWAAAIGLVLVLAYGVFWIQSDRAQAAFNRSVRTNDIEAAREAAAIDPALHLYPLQIAYLTGEQAEAIAAYRQALQLEPTWDTGWINLAALQERADDIDGALESLAQAERFSVRNLATFNRARLMETYQTAPDDEIVQTYVRALEYMPLPLSA